MEPTPPVPPDPPANPQSAQSPAASHHTDPLQASGLAVFALVLSVLGIIAPGMGILAIILGVIALNQIDDVANRLKGRGLAVAGTLLGGLGTITSSGLVILALILPAMEHVRVTGPGRAQPSMQFRAIHQQMVVYAQSNKNWFPGLTPTGVVDSWGAVSNRYGVLARLLKEDFYTEEYLVSSAEVDPTINGTAVRGVSTSLGSFAVLEYASATSVLAPTTTLGNLEWRESLRTTAIVLSDRELATGLANPRSVWTSVNGQWQGAVAFNDNHIQFELTDKGYNGQYGQNRGTFGTGSINNLFDMQGGNGQMTSD